MVATTAALIQAGIGGAAALGGAIYGGIKSGKYNRKAEALIQKQRDDNKAWWNVKNASDYTQRADVQAAITKQRELLNEQYKRAKATNTVAGGTAESIALQKQAANASLAQTASEVAAAGANYKERMENQYRAQDAALNQQQAENNRQIAKETAAAASQLVNAGIGTVGGGVNNFIKAQTDAVTPTEVEAPTVATTPNGGEWYMGGVDTRKKVV